jgi:sugar fermentation stimulation protein A
MNFENQLISGVLIKRYKRFFVDVKVKDKILTAHCPNTGSMMGLLSEGNKVWISKSNNGKRKLKYTLQIIECNGNKVGVNTHITNKIVLEALENNFIKHFKKNIIIQTEKKFGEDTRFDFLINDLSKKSFIEVKNVTLSRKKKLAEFPDSVTKRGAKHINNLILAAKQGYMSYLLFVIQREDCNKFAIANDIDPKYSELLTFALKKNIIVLCYDCKFSSKGIKLNNQIKLQTNDY